MNKHTAFLIAEGRLAVDGGFAYIAHETQDAWGLRIIDISDPAGPVRRGFVEIFAPPAGVVGKSGLA